MTSKMIFDTNKEFNDSKQELLDIIIHPDYREKLLKWVNAKSKSGCTKQNIYAVLTLLFRHIQQTEDVSDQLYDRLADFLDGFTAWSKSAKTLPGEPDI